MQSRNLIKVIRLIQSHISINYLIRKLASPRAHIENWSSLGIHMNEIKLLNAAQWKARK